MLYTDVLIYRRYTAILLPEIEVDSHFVAKFLLGLRYIFLQVKADFASEKLTAILHTQLYTCR